tara:strand:- start:2510 stop:2824 length:315 start_codon:yes stop_codon:yes gene_type:complete
MTDSNIQPPDTTGNPVPGTDVTYTTPAGLYPESTDPNIVVTTGTTADTYTVDPYASAVDFHVDNMQSAPADPRIDHVLEHLHNLEAKIDDIHARLDGVSRPPTT